MDICLICLRTNNRIKLSTGLTEFHDELCGFTVSLLAAKSLYCSECKSLLIKFYKFKQKCVKAAKIYRDWMSGMIKDPIQDLHKMLPPSTLSMWQPSNTIAYITLKKIETDIEEANLKSNYVEDVKVEGPKINSVNIKSRHRENDSISQNDHLSDNDNQKEPITKSRVHLQSDFEGREYAEFDIIGKNDTEDEAKDSIKNLSLNNKPNAPKKCKMLRTSNKPKASKSKVTVNKIHHKNTSKKTRRSGHKKESNNRSKEELLLKLSSFGDMETADGTAVDKDLITKLMNHATAAPVIKKMWNATCREDILDLSKDIKSSLASINRSDIFAEYGSIFDIEYLTTREKKVEEFRKRKTYECYLKAEHKCEICYQLFRGPIHLKSHMDTFHDESAGGEFCSICKVRMPLNSQNRSRHAESHLAVFRCKLCPHVTYNRNTMKEHAKKHKGDMYQCEICQISYKCMSAYYNHMSKCHRRVRVVCRVCGRGFRSARSLQVHTALAHRNASPAADGAGVPCVSCDVTLPSQAVLEAHIRDVHEAPAPPDVAKRRERDGNSLPGYTISTTSRPRKGGVPHESYHKKMTCRVCNASRAGSGWLRAHFRREHPDLNMDVLYADGIMHLCDVCGFGTSSIYRLRDHMNLHSGALPHACDLCPKRCRSAVLLRNHRLHHFPAALPCARCGKRFKTKSNLYNHMKSHTGERSYKCHICEKGFISSASLNEHIRGVHYKIRRGKRGATREGGAENGGSKIAKRQRILSADDNISPYSSDESE